MLYLNTKDIQAIGMNWTETIDVIEQTVRCMGSGNFHQPIKPYLNFADPSNRIIAMPAYVGDEIDIAGIKWIASFPKNIDNGIQRAHSVTILNDAHTGKPISIFNTAIVSGIRTASVTGLMIREAAKVRKLENLRVGLIGFGPIGQLHLQMLISQLGDRIARINLFDLREINRDLIPEAIRDRLHIVSSWAEAYEGADVFVTCTVSSQGYIDKKPKPCSLQLNVSLRDYTPAILDYTRSIVVDNWEEVCRANTDIEAMHNTRGLQKEDTRSIVEVVCHNALHEFPQEEAIMFNPMGMAAFDIAIADYYYKQAIANGIGLSLEE